MEAHFVEQILLVERFFRGITGKRTRCYSFTGMADLKLAIDL